LSGIDQVAFENPDGRKVLVVTNSGDAKAVILKQANKMAEFALTANSINTLCWM
jgi:O-glycosyl hydrolase